MGRGFPARIQRGHFDHQRGNSARARVLPNLINSAPLWSEFLHTVPEVISTARRTGRAELDEHVQGVESAEIDVDLKMRDRPKEAVLEEIREKVTLLPGMNVSIGQPISHRIDHMLSGTRANIAVKIFGDDSLTLACSGQTGQRSDERSSGRRRPFG